MGVVLADLERARAALDRCEQLHVSGQVLWQAPAPADEKPMGGCWLQHRMRQGHSNGCQGIFIQVCGGYCNTAAAY
ncbi:hypothetical protein AAF134_11470 [Synechococcus lacustris Tous-12m]